MVKILIVDTGETYDCPPDKDILRGMEALGRKGIPVGCRGGGCGICKIKVLEGRFEPLKMSRAHITPDDLAQGIILACRAFPRSELRIKVLGRMSRVFDPNRLGGAAARQPQQPEL